MTTTSSLSEEQSLITRWKHEVTAQWSFWNRQKHVDRCALCVPELPRSLPTGRIFKTKPSVRETNSDSAVRQREINSDGLLFQASRQQTKTKVFQHFLKTKYKSPTHTHTDTLTCLTWEHSALESNFSVLKVFSVKESVCQWIFFALTPSLYFYTAAPHF